MTKFILSKAESAKIREVHFYRISFYEKNAIPIDNQGNIVNFPTLEELAKMAIEKILEAGFHEVKRVAPNDANCIIRVFNKLHYAYQENMDEIHNLCGFNCFSKKLCAWVSIADNGDEFNLDFSKCVQRQWIYQDEYIDYDCNFFDCYVYVR